MSEDDALGLDYEVKQPATIQVGQLIQPQAGNDKVTPTETENPTILMTTQASQSVAQAVAPASSSWEDNAIPVAILLLATISFMARRKQHSHT